MQEEREEVPAALHLLPGATSIQESKRWKAYMLILLNEVRHKSHTDTFLSSYIYANYFIENNIFFF